MYHLDSSVSRVLSLALLLGTMLGTMLGCGAQAPERSSPHLRVMSYNVKHGRGMDDRVDLERTAAVIRRVGPDIVALQEIDVGCGRSGGIDEARRLGELCGMDSAFGRFMEYDGGEYGMALLSRHEILEVVNVNLPPGSEPRTSLVARIRLTESGSEVVVAGIHFYRTEEQRLAQARALVSHLQNETSPVILVGDFNAEPDDPVMRFLEETFTNVPKGADRFTYPSDRPDKEIDYVLYRPATFFRLSAIDVLDEPLASDHRPLYADFAVR